jgi:hypothetical protein
MLQLDERPGEAAPLSGEDVCGGKVFATRGQLLLANAEDRRRLFLMGKRGAAWRQQLLRAALENASARVSCGFQFFSPASSSSDLRNSLS